jgi:hypothetical protein
LERLPARPAMASLFGLPMTEAGDFEEGDGEMGKWECLGGEVMGDCDVGVRYE